MDEAWLGTTSVERRDVGVAEESVARDTPSEVDDGGGSDAPIDVDDDSVGGGAADCGKVGLMGEASPFVLGCFASDPLESDRFEEEAMRLDSGDAA